MIKLDLFSIYQEFANKERDGLGYNNGVMSQVLFLSILFKIEGFSANSTDISTLIEQVIEELNNSDVYDIFELS